MDPSTASPAQTRRKHWPTAEHPEVRLLSGLRHRGPGRLDLHVDDPPADPSLDELVAAAAAWPQADGVVLSGGEPTLRPDLPRLIRALADAGAPRLGLSTDGLAITQASVASMLGGVGLRRVRVRLHSARHDAHDWLEDTKGAWRRAVRALQSTVEAGLEAEIECVVTRPSAPYLEELTELAARLGVKAVLLRRLTARGPALGQDVALLPRLGLTAELIDTAVQVGVRKGLRMMVEGFPQCAASGSAAWLLPTDAVVWAVPASGGWPFLRPAVEPPPSGPGCARCPGPPACCGAPSDYTRRFGRAEIDSEGARRVNPGALPPTPLEGGDVRPPPRAGRTPPTRPAYARAAARMPSMGGDPLVAVQKVALLDRVRTVFVAPSRVPVPHLGDHPGPTEPESTRDIRIRLVRLAQHGADTVRIASAGSLAHPAVGEMLRESTRLELPRIEVAGEASALDELGDMELRRLRGLSRIDAALFAPHAHAHDALLQRPGAFDATLAALDRVAELVPSLAVGVYAVLHDERDLLTWAELWDRGELPGEPWFRLASRGGDLLRLARAAEQLPPGLARDAIAAVLPTALFGRADVLPAPEAELAWGDLPERLRAPSGADRYGCYTDRPSRAGGPQPGDDPGLAVGWTVDGASPSRLNPGA
jgi:hypothetical protein